MRARSVSSVPGDTQVLLSLGKVPFQKRKYSERKTGARIKPGRKLDLRVPGIGRWVKKPLVPHSAHWSCCSANGSARLHSGLALFLSSRNGGLKKVFAYGSDTSITDF